MPDFLTTCSSLNLAQWSVYKFDTLVIWRMSVHVTKYFNQKKATFDLV